MTYAFGAIVHYYLSEDFKLHGSDKILLSIKNAKGQQVSQITLPATAGLHRVVWNLQNSPQPQPQRGTQGRRARKSNKLVEPGEYTISLLNVSDGNKTTLGKSQTIQVKPISSTP